MKRWEPLVCMILSCLLLAIRPAFADGIVPGHVLVRLQVETEDEVETLDDDYRTTVTDQVAGTGLYSLRTPKGISAAEFARELSADPRVAWAETDTYLFSPEVDGNPFHFPFDRSRKPGKYLKQAAYAQVNMGHALARTTGAGIIIAVLDTGATFDHPALSAHYLDGYNALNPAQPAYDLPDGTFNFSVGHGTMIAGILAYLAPDAQILPVRVLNGDGVGTVLTVAKGIDYAISAGAKVINLSLGTWHPSQALMAAINEARQAGVVVVASAGNSDVNQRYYPAAAKGVLAVTSVEADNRKSLYADFGTFVKVVAPGSNIRSTYVGGDYATWSGTSFAAPFLSAEAALVLSLHPTFTAQQVAEWVRATAHKVDPFNPQYIGQLGAGIIDIDAAVTNKHIGDEGEGEDEGDEGEKDDD